MRWVLFAPAQTTLLRAVKVRASELHLVPDQGWTPSGGAKDPGTDTPPPTAPLRWEHLESKFLSRQEGPPGAL